MNAVAAPRFLVFTKPWPDLSLPELARHVAGMGFNGVELPVRPGFPVTPDNAADADHGLPAAARVFADHGLTIESVAAEPDERILAACAQAGVPLVRVCPALETAETYTQAETRLRRAWDALVPRLEDTSVTLGVQNHNGRYAPTNALGLARLLAGYHPRHVGAVWDAAHEALDGMEPEMALDVVWPHLILVNLKNALRERAAANGSSGEAHWHTHWVGARDGFASWPRVAAELIRRGWPGSICLPAEYSDPAIVDEQTTADLAFARELFPGQPHVR